MSAPRVFVADVKAQVVALSEPEAHHVGRVMRLSAGDPIIIFNGRGQSWDAEIAACDKRGVTATIVRPRAPLPQPRTRVSLAIALLKGDAMDDVVRDVTALGVSEIIPMMTSHTVVPKRARGEDAIARWQRVAIASAKQCGQTVLPSITAVSDFADVLKSQISPRLICVEPALGGSELSAIASDSVLILIGPEGGWSQAEVDTALAAGFHAITLGGLTLRAELAPVVAVTTVNAAVRG